MTRNILGAMGYMFKGKHDEVEGDDCRAFLAILNDEPAHGLEHVVRGNGYETVAICTTAAVIAEPDFNSGWLKALWDVFINPSWTVPEEWLREHDSRTTPLLASTDFLLGFFLGLLEALSESTPPEYFTELTKRLPVAIARLNSTSGLIRYGYKGMSSEHDQKDWEGRVEAQLKKFSGRFSDCDGWQVFLAETIRRLPPPKYHTWQGRCRMYAPSLTRPTEHVIDCLRWAGNKRPKPYEGLITLANSPLRKPHFPLVV